MSNRNSDIHLDALMTAAEGHKLSGEDGKGDGGKSSREVENNGEANDSPSSSSASESASSSSSSSSSALSSAKDGGAKETALYVPPGNGSSRTRRNNRMRRAKERQRNEKQQQLLFEQACERTLKRAQGEELDEHAVASEWQQQAPVKMSKKRKGKAAHLDSEVEVSEMTTSYRDRQSEAQAKKSIGKVILPPSQRNDPIPEGIRLTRVDCDECFNPWPTDDDEANEAEQEIAKQFDQDRVVLEYDKEDEKDDAYSVFQATAKKELQRMRDEDELRDQISYQKQAEQVNLDEGRTDALHDVMGLPMAFGKTAGWDGQSYIGNLDK